MARRHDSDHSIAYVDRVLDAVRPRLLERAEALASSGVALPPPDEMAALLGAGLPSAGVDLDPHYADLGPFYDSAGAMHQLGQRTKQGLQSRRDNRSVLAVRTGDGHWLYPAWQFDGAGAVRAVLAPVLRALRRMEPWAAGVWLVADHPDLGGVSPRQALRDGVDPDVVAVLARRDTAALVA